MYLHMATGWAWQGEQRRGVYVLTHDHWVGMTRRAKERCVCTYTRPLGGHDKESKGEVCMYLHTTTGWAWQGEQRRGVYVLTHDHWVGMTRRAKERCDYLHMTTGWAWQGEQRRGVYVLTHDHWVGMARRAKERCVCTYTRPLGGHGKESKGEVYMYLHTTTGWA